MKRAKLGMMKRNALIAAGNADDAALRVRIDATAHDESECELVRTTAEVVLKA